MNRCTPRAADEAICRGDLTQFLHSSEAHLLAYTVMLVGTQRGLTVGTFCAALIRVVQTPGRSSSKASDVERSWFALICVLRSAIVCSVVAKASAPAMKRRGGGSWLATVIRAREFRGSPDCRPFCDFQYSTTGPRRSS